MSKKSFGPTIEKMRESYKTQFKKIIEKRYPIYWKSLKELYDCKLDVFLNETYECMCLRIFALDGEPTDERAEQIAESIDRIFAWLPVYLVATRSIAMMASIEEDISDDLSFAKIAIEDIKRSTKTMRIK